MVAITLENPKNLSPEGVKADDLVAMAGMHVLASAMAGMAVGVAMLTLPMMLGWW